MISQPPPVRHNPSDTPNQPSQPPVLDSTPPTEEQKKLVAFFTEAEIKQVDFLDEAGKRIIELTTALLGVLFAVIAFGDKFPPPYLKDNPLGKFLSLTALALYVVAMFMALRTVQPRNYKLYRHNLDRMRQELDNIVANKKRTLWFAGVLFWSASTILALLIASIIFTA